MKRDSNWFDSAEFEQNYTYDGTDLGAVWTPEATIFKVWAPTAEEVLLNVYILGSPEEAKEKFAHDYREIYQMKPESGGVWTKKVENNIEGIYYTFTVKVDGKSLETADPYGKACGVNGKRSMVIDMQKTERKEWSSYRRSCRDTENPVIYELHIKDFSSDENSGILPEYRGKYMAFTQQNTWLDQEKKYPTCIEYLKRLGITYVHLLPVFDYGSVNEKNTDGTEFNWGYDPVNYNIPEGSYATDPYDGYCRIIEFKEMVEALHDAGIGVIMDVVYNHTYNLEVPLQKTVPDYFYRKNQDGTYANGSACGNDTASERKMFRKYMIDSVCYWAREYHIDGFRFDLMGLHDVETMNRIREALDKLPDGRKILMYGEPWAAAKSPMNENSLPAIAGNIGKLNERIAMFSDIIRDNVKGHVFYAEKKGYINGDEEEVALCRKNIISSIAGLCRQENEKGIRTLAPSQVINYVSAHDDWTLWDKLLAAEGLEGKNLQEEQLRKLIQMNKMAAGIVFTCMGTPFIHAGEEFARTKNGCRNSYKSSVELNQLDWKRTIQFADLKEYYHFLIMIRREIPILNRKDFEAAKKITFLEEKKEETAKITFLIDGKEEGGKWKEVMVCYNPYEEEKESLLGKERWVLLSDGVEKHALNGIQFVEKKVWLKPRSVTILAR